MASTTDRWNALAAKLVGRKIMAARYLTQEEADNLGWSKRCLVMMLDDGSMLFPSRDDEGNGAGAMFGQTKDGEDLTFPVLSRGL